jgi:hypothetical protein
MRKMAIAFLGFLNFLFIAATIYNAVTPPKGTEIPWGGFILLHGIPILILSTSIYVLVKRKSRKKSI